MSHPPVRCQKGASLIEVIVALLVFSCGVLGLVTTQAMALQYRQNAWARSAATGLAADIAERVRANSAAAWAGDYAYAVGYRAASVARHDEPAYCGGTPRQVAACDLAVWAASAVRRMPGGAANLSGDARQGFTATLMWLEREGGDGGDDGMSGSGGMEESAASASACASDAPFAVRCVRLRFLP